MTRLAVLLGCLAALGSCSQTVAAWAPGATGSGSARAHVMPAGPAPLPVTAGLGTVSLTWTGATFAGGPAVAGYVVRRFDTVTSVEAVVGGSCAGVVAATSCTDTGVPAGSWSYSVTAAQGAWRGAESSRVPVLVL